VRYYKYWSKTDPKTLYGSLRLYRKLFGLTHDQKDYDSLKLTGFDNVPSIVDVTKKKLLYPEYKDKYEKYMKDFESSGCQDRLNQHFVKE
jgi:hypothetical protein